MMYGSIDEKKKRIRIPQQVYLLWNPMSLQNYTATIKLCIVV